MDIKPFKKAHHDENERRTLYQQELFEKQKQMLTNDKISFHPLQTTSFQQKEKEEKVESKPNSIDIDIIDEPELGLHPYAIQLLAGMMKSCSTKTQVIAATQSVTLLNQFTFEDLIVVDRKDNASVFKRPTKEEADTWMEEYGLGELWEKNWLGGTP